MGAMFLEVDTLTKRFGGLVAVSGVSLQIEEGEIGVNIALAIPRGRFAVMQKRRRALAGRTGCGLCGVDDLTQIVRPIPPVGRGRIMPITAVHRALADLPARQTINRQTGAVHAAAWADPEGTIKLVREDVGRHNALEIGRAHV